MSPDPDQEYFSDGIAEELLNQLTKVRGLQVAGRTSTFAFKGTNEDFRVIGEKLNVAHILEGSVRKAGNRVRITVQLVKAADGFHLWSETFDRDLTDIFAIQEETAEAVASALSIALGVGVGDLNAGGTRNFEAYDAYLAGISLAGQDATGEGFVQTIERLEEAVALDPDYAQAWATLAYFYRLAATFFIAEGTEELYQKAEAAASRAIEIAPEAVASLRAAAQLQRRNRD
jgi:TolB-like protein